MNPSDITSLTRALELSISTAPPQKQHAVTASVAYSRSGASYPAGTVSSQTHILDLPSELAALVRATHHGDYPITEVHTMAVDPATPVSPLALKALADHTARTGTAIRYAVFDMDGNILFSVDDARNALPFYRMPEHLLSAATDPTRIVALPQAREVAGESIESQLRRLSLAGTTLNFPTRDGASGYGAAVRTKDGTFYYGGQYSSFDKRLGIHAEVAVLVNALMSGASDITHLGIISSKATDTPCNPCGCCRQFISELARARTFEPQIWCFASATEQANSYAIDELLPSVWTNRR
ncbi:MAG: hypothetical protein WDN10_02885 [bacterium]